ncbi:hypothetical protein FB45DRAFT_101400 [Roridomyces roridus]|uniref:Uncharacterized protein n=1 Tax=Roridomyces roridus TaxID=1738132 RepID=A0AAD7BJP2_9AGAR|nr:hypothetical protein FB45DRAFT_101400 [Roridomyces roridus]
MPYPTPITTELNLLFENRSPQKPRGNARSYSPVLSSPASSTSTLALEDDEIQSIFSSAKLVSRDSDQLNPLATPFVPTFSRPQPVRRASVPANPKPVQLPPKWLDAFSRGASHAATPLHEQYAAAIVASRTWPIEAMAELAQHFCCKGSEKITEESAGIAPFAFMVYRQFFDLLGEQTAQSFIWHLRECVVGAFKACWDPDYPNAITYYNAPSFNYVSSAIAQATFIGQLFTYDLIPAPHATACLFVLIKGLSSYEHIDAIRALVTAAGPSFWHGRGAPGAGNMEIHKFVATFLEAASPLRANMSVLGRSLKPNDMRDIIAEVETLVTGWVYDSVRGAFGKDVTKVTLFTAAAIASGRRASAIKA